MRRHKSVKVYNHSQWTGNYPINLIAISNYQIISAMNKSNNLDLDITTIMLPSQKRAINMHHVELKMFILH